MDAWPLAFLGANFFNFLIVCKEKRTNQVMHKFHGIIRLGKTIDRFVDNP